MTRWSADDGLPHSQVHDIAQARDGHLWLTGWEGTSRFDGTAFVSHLLTRTSGALELRARATAIAVIIVPVQILVVVAVCLVTSAVAYLPVGLGVLGASVGAGLASAALLSVLAPYSLPESQNPFSTNTGSGSMKGLFAFVALLATLVLSLPITLAAVLIPDPAWGWALLAAGLAYGLGAVRLGTRLAGDILERMTAAGQPPADKVRVIYESPPYPSGAIGYVYNLTPELRDGIRETLLNFDWAGTGLEQIYGPSGSVKFVPVSYKDDWAPVREINEAGGKIMTELEKPAA